MTTDELLTSVMAQIKELEKELDDILWSQGVTDRAQIIERELGVLREMQNAGELYTPNF